MKKMVITGMLISLKTQYEHKIFPIKLLNKLTVAFFSCVMQICGGPYSKYFGKPP